MKHCKYRKFIQKIENHSLERLRQLVEINSQTCHREGVNQVGRECSNLFSPLGFTPRIIPSGNLQYGDYFFLTRKGKSSKNIFFISHLDTVYSTEEEIQNSFSWWEKGDRIYGPGVADIKGGTIVIYMVLLTLQEMAPLFFEEVTWHIFLNPREEEGTPEFSQLVTPYVNENSLAALVYEAGGMTGESKTSQIVQAGKGVARFHVAIKGRQAHSGTDHEKGVNALLEMAKQIVTIEKWTDYQKGLTFNVGKAQGGIAINRVPGYADFFVDVRSLTPEDLEYATQLMEGLQGKGSVTSPLDGCTSEVNIQTLPRYPCWPINEKSERLGQIFIDIGTRIDAKILLEFRSGASDGSFFWHLLPTIDGLGPVGANDHCSVHKPEEGKEQEFVLRSSFLERTLLNVQGIIELYETFS